jgi:hypothetical protein
MPPVAPDTGLAALEMTVVALALRDPLWSVDEPRRWTWGPQAQARRLQLANPRLEALRRFVVLARHGRRIESTLEAAVLLAAGFSQGQIHHTNALIRQHGDA